MKSNTIEIIISMTNKVNKQLGNISSLVYYAAVYIDADCPFV
jgi:hypothetical protein